MPLPVKAKHAPAPKRHTANWSGGQIGASNGISSVSNNFVDPGAYVCPAGYPFGATCMESPFSFGGNSLSYTIGSFLGYRWQLGTQVIGIEADWAWKRGVSAFGQSIPVVCFDAPDCFNYRSDTKSGTIKQTWDSSLRLRYGWLVDPSILIYGTAGVAVGQIGGTFGYNGITYAPNCVGGACSTANAAASWSDTRVGWTIGAGTETEIWSGWKARIEYRYTDFGRYTKTIPVTTACLANGCSAPSTAAAIDLRESFQTVRVGLGLDF